MTDVQNWQATKVDRLKPMMQRQTMKEALELTRDMPNTAEEDSRSRKPMAYLGPNLLVMVPMIRRAKMVPVICTQGRTCELQQEGCTLWRQHKYSTIQKKRELTAARLAPATAFCVRLRSWRIYGIRGGAAKVEKKVVKKHSLHCRNCQHIMAYSKLCQHDHRKCYQVRKECNASNRLPMSPTKSPKMHVIARNLSILIPWFDSMHRIGCKQSRKAYQLR